MRRGDEGGRVKRRREEMGRGEEYGKREGIRRGGEGREETGERRGERSREEESVVVVGLLLMKSGHLMKGVQVKEGLAVKAL